VAVVQYTFTHSTQNTENGTYITIKKNKNGRKKFEVILNPEKNN
jgi:hypothetical protein